jgi:alpha-1,2-mannosyltransferase
MWLAAAAAAAWLPLLGMPARHWLDFDAFYGAGLVAFTPRVVDLTSILEYQAAHGLPLTPFLYPPGFALLYVPFTWLPFDLAAAVHVLLQAGALLGAAILGAPLYGIPRRWAVLGALAWAPAVAGVISGQNSAVLLLLVVISVTGITGGPVPAGTPWALAGLALGAAVWRPQLGLPLGAVALWRGAWRAIAVALAVIGVVATGGAWNWPAQWLRIVGAETAEDFASVGWQALSLPGLLGRLSVDGSPEGALSAPALLGYAVGGIVVLASLHVLRTWDAPRAMALACALALFAGPRGWSYDGTLLWPTVAVLVRDASDRGWPWEYRWMLAASYAAALAWPLGGIIGINPEALLVLGAPFVLRGVGPFKCFRTTASGG